MANPQIRFKRDTGQQYPDWETYPFNDAFTAIGNNTLSRADLSDSGIVRNLHYGDILTKLGNIVDPEKDNLPFIADKTKVAQLGSHLLKNGDVIFADTAEDDMVGKAVEMTSCINPVVSGLHTTPCRPVSGLFEPGYLGYYLNSPSYHNQLRPLMQGIKVTSVSRTAMGETEVARPSDKKEQEKIATFFTELDNLISAAVDEVAALEEAKKGMIQKIFSREIRFKREDGTDYSEWEDTTLAAFLFENKDRNKANGFDANDVLSVSGEFGVVNQIEFQGRSFAGSDVSLYHILYTGDIVYTKSPLKASPYGIIKFNDGPTGIVSTLYAVYHCKPNVNGKFVEYYFSNNLTLNKYLKPLVSIGAKHDMKINNDYVLSGSVCFPCRDEQIAIVDFLTNLDAAIAAAKDELAGYRELKRGLLQQMFA